MATRLQLGPAADGSLAALETVCTPCNGTGFLPSSRERAVFHAGGQCSTCNGMGTIPTDDGKRLLAFLRRHSR